MSDQAVLDLEVIFSSHIMFINASPKEFTLINNVIPSNDIAFEHLLYYKLAPPILWSAQKVCLTQRVK